MAQTGTPEAQQLEAQFARHRSFSVGFMHASNRSTGNVIASASSRSASSRLMCGEFGESLADDGVDGNGFIEEG